MLNSEDMALNPLNIDNNSVFLNIDDKLSILEEFFKSKMPSYATEFTRNGSKNVGCLNGYLAKKKDTNQMYMIKTFISDYNDCYDANERNEWISNIREFIVGDIYKLLMYSRSADIGLIIQSKSSNPKTPDKSSISSKFLPNVQTLKEFIDSNIISTSNKFKHLVGFEKAIMASVITGNFDLHNENLLVQTVQNGKFSAYVINQIDYGASFENFYSNFQKLIKYISEIFYISDYKDHIIKGNLKFNISECIQALEQMLKLDPNLIKNIFHSKVALLGPYSFREDELIDSKVDRDGKCNVLLGANEEIVLNDFDEFLKNFEFLKTVLDKFKIINLFDNMTELFKNGKWLFEIATAMRSHPILYAIEYNIMIKGLDPLEWYITEYCKNYLNEEAIDEDFVNISKKDLMEVFNELDCQKLTNVSKDISEDYKEIILKIIEHKMQFDSHFKELHKAFEVPSPARLNDKSSTYIGSIEAKTYPQVKPQNLFELYCLRNNSTGSKTHKDQEAEKVKDIQEDQEAQPYI